MDRIRNLIGAGRLREAIELLIKVAHEPYKQQALQLKTRYSTIQLQEIGGGIDFNTLNIERNKLTASALSLLSLIEQQPLSTVSASPTSVPVPGKNGGSSPSNKQKVYFSYAWGEPGSERDRLVKVVDELYESLQKQGFNVFRDSRNIKFGELISEYMQELAEGDLILVFVSDKYVRSPYCMFELHEIARNSKWDRAVFVDKVLPIPLEHIRFDRPAVLKEYMTYWAEQELEWRDFVTSDIDDIGGGNFKRYQNIRVIKRKFGELSDWLIDINASSLSLVSEDDYELVKRTILERLSNS